jgi:hypothetical protein
MMLRPLIYLGLFVLSVAIAIARGGAPERLAATFYTVAYILSNLITQVFFEHFEHLQIGVLFIDIMLGFVLIYLSLISNRYWTIWASSFQIVAITAHLTKWIVPGILSLAYEISLVVWSYAVIPLLVIATYRHTERKRRYGSDLDWSFV